MKRFKYLTLAALVAFAACDDGQDVVVQPDINGTISGAVTIEGEAQSGVTVTLSSGQTTATDGSGVFTFAGVPAGAYTVTISGFASDATFSATSKAATIATAGQTVTVNFDGAFVRTSAIIGSVSAGGTGLEGVNVAIGSANTTTDASGQYTFSGLRAGTYTVTMSGFDNTQYAFSTTSQEVTVAVGESKIVSFNGLLLSTGTISGVLYIDANPNGVKDSGESDLTIANVTIAAERAIGDTIYTTTDANGLYAFSNLEQGKYKVLMVGTQTNLAGRAVTYSGAASQIVDAATGTTTTVNMPFVVTTQYVRVGAFLGWDQVPAQAAMPKGSKARVRPVAGATIALYNTQLNAAAGGTTGRIGAPTASGADGMATFKFLRTADNQPATATSDNIVFATLNAPKPGPNNQVANGEAIIEIPFPAGDTITDAADEFDLLNTTVILKYNNVAPRGPLSGWSGAIQQADTSVARTTDATMASTTAGVTRFVVTTAVASFPDTIFYRLSKTQPFLATLGHGWNQSATAVEGNATGRYSWVIHDGTLPDSMIVGTQTVRFTDMHVITSVHHETDDSTSTPTFTAGDALDNVDNVQVELRRVNTNGTTTVVGATTGVIGSGAAVFFNVPVGPTYQIRSRSLAANQVVLNDTMHTVTLAGDWFDTTHAPLRGGAGPSTFAYKYNNNTITGVARDSSFAVTNANGLTVTVAPTAMNTQPGMTSATTTTAGGAYAFTGLREGPYTVTISDGDSATVWDFTRCTTATGCAANAAALNTVNNTDAFNGTRDMQGNLDNDIVNFVAVRLDTSIRGVVINDRDNDFNTIDPDEALSGVTVNLIQDTDRDGVVDTNETTVLTTATTGGNGDYTFSNLREGFYHVSVVQPTNAQVLRALAATGAVTATASVNTTSIAGTACVAATPCNLNQSGTRQAGNTSPNAQGDELPRWNYLAGTAATAGAGINAVSPNVLNAALTTAPTHFVHLFTTGTVTGQVGTMAAAVFTGRAGVRVTVTRCQTAAIAPSPPAAGACTTKHGTPSPWVQNVDSDGTGSFTFTGLLEGVYQVDVAPQTAGYTNIVTPGAPGSYLATLQGNADIETTPNFVIS